jgi:protein ImuA
MAETQKKQDRRALIAAARRQIGAFEAPARARLKLGAEEIEACLKGGLETSALHEVAAADHRALPAAQGFLLSLARIAAPKGVIVWPMERRAGEFGAPYAPGLKAFGLDPAAILFIRCRTREETLWTMEEALRIGGIGAVVGTRPPRMDLTASRRLQLAAETSGTPIFLLRTYKDDEHSAAATRWRVKPMRAAKDGHGFLSSPRWHVTLERTRGGRTGEWVVEFNHDALCLRIPAGLRGGALPAARTRSAA